MPICMPERMPDLSEYRSGRISLGGDHSKKVIWLWLVDDCGWKHAKLYEHSLLSVAQAVENAGSSTLSVTGQLLQNRMQKVE